MTVRIRIPSSEEEPPAPEGHERPEPRLPALLAAGTLVASVLVALAVSVSSAGDPLESSVPAPFETSEQPDAQVLDVPPAWSERTLPGDGEILAMGTIGDTPVAVVSDWRQLLIWQRNEEAWHLDGVADLGAVESAVVMDDRVLVIGYLEGRPAVWEWVDGSHRYLFGPTSGFIDGAWSVGGRLFVSTAETAIGVEATVRHGRRDALWVESTDGEFEEMALINIESVLAVVGDADRISVGGRDAEGRAAVGVVHDGTGRVLANPVPGAPEGSAVTDLAGGPESVVALVSIADRPGGMGAEIRFGARDWELIAEGSGLVGIEVVDDVVYGASPAGALLVVPLDGSELPVPSVPRPSYTQITGMGSLGAQPVMFGRRTLGPAYVGPDAGSAEVVLRGRSWERYHSEASDGFALFHIGSLEFATRDGELFHRAWNADRWHPTESDGDMVLFGSPAIVELDWGYVLVPATGSSLWASPDGSVWSRVHYSDPVRIQEVASDGEVVVGVTSRGTVDGPATDVVVVARDGAVTRSTLPYQLVGLLWEDGVGFAGTVAPPSGGGYAISQAGVEWVLHDGSESFDRVVGLQGSLYFASGQSVVPGDPAADVPSSEGWLFSYGGGVPMWTESPGPRWVHTGHGWLEVDLSAVDGLPGSPHRLVVRGSTVFAMVTGIDGFAETYLLGLD